jgi:hypothetical protein
LAGSCFVIGIVNVLRLIRCGSECICLTHARARPYRKRVRIGNMSGPTKSSGCRPSNRRRCVFVAEPPGRGDFSRWEPDRLFPSVTKVFACCKPVHPVGPEAVPAECGWARNGGHDGNLRTLPSGASRNGFQTVGFLAFSVGLDPPIDVKC